MTAPTAGRRLARRLLGALAIGVLAGTALAGCMPAKVDGPASTGEAGQLADELAGYAADVEALAPAELREAVIRRLTGALEASR